nr:hypothetical protein [Pedobacter agri]
MKTYSLLHIDRHPDMENLFAREGFHLYKNVDFESISIEDLLELKVNNHQLLRWNNFIELYNVFHPYTIQGMEFVGNETLPLRLRHEKKQSLLSWIKTPLTIDELVELESKKDLGKIIDLDIDVFFKELSNGRYKEILSAEQLKQFSDKIKPFIDRAALTTVALSPECCGGWDNAVNMFNKLNNHLQILPDNLEIQ